MAAEEENRFCFSREPQLVTLPFSPPTRDIEYPPPERNQPAEKIYGYPQNIQSNRPATNR